jgi:Flp pilus assembly secretin CpaC
MTLLTSLFIMSIFVNSARSEVIILSPGDVRPIEAPLNQSISVEKGQVIQIRDHGKRAMIVAKKMGRSKLTVGPRSYQVHIVSGKTSADARTLEETLKKFRGLKMTINDSNALQITGQLHRLSDWKALVQLAEDQHIDYTFAAQIDADIQDSARLWLLPFVRTAGLSEDTLSFDPTPQVFISPPLEKNRSYYIDTLKKWGLRVSVKPGQISQLPSVMLDLVLAEIDKTFEQEVGILWGQSDQTGTYKAKVLPQLSEGELYAQINLIESEGHGQILARPSLLSRSGEKAEFHAGGEMPIRISGWGSQNVEWKKYGIIMHFHPKADNEGRMSLTIDTEISIPNLNQTTDQLPIFEVNRVKSHFDLDRSRTVVISGLIRDSQNEFRQGLPFLSRIPVLGRLFGSPKFQSRKTELVVFVTPRVLKPSELDSIPVPDLKK